MRNPFDYTLIDFGNGRKLERFGSVVLDRPEVLAKAQPGLSPREWQKLSHGKFISKKENKKGIWARPNQLPENWECSYQAGGREMKFQLKPGKFKHTGLFPEQEKHWEYLQEHIKPGDRVLNLFAYTGASSLVAAAAGGDVFHIDASKSVVKWARRNAKASGIDTIHWVTEDALKFAQRENKRGRNYRFILMDPPVYGRGTKGEHWRLEDMLPQLVSEAAKLLEPGGVLILNTYSPTTDLPEMVKVCENYGLQSIEKGWLSVSTETSGRELKLSKYIIAKAKS